MKINNFVLFLWLACIAILFGACTPPTDSRTSPTTLPVVETATPSKTYTMTPQATNTKTPAFVLPTELSLEEERAYIRKKLENNGGCDFPCILGVDPSNDENKNRKLFKNFGEEGSLGYDEYENSGLIIYTGEIEEEYLVFGFDYVFLKNLQKLNLILENYWVKNRPEIGTYYTGIHESSDFVYYRIDQILTKYGKPSEVWVGAWFLEPRSDFEDEPFTISMYYPERGFLIEYKGYVVNESTEKWSLCPWQVHIYLTSWNPAEMPTLKQLGMGNADTWLPHNLDYFKPVQEASGISLDEFYELFKDSSAQACIETDAALWTEFR